MTDKMESDAHRKLVRETVQETLLGLGFDMMDPNRLQADMHYLRKLRDGSEDVARIIRRSAITLSLSTGVYLLWEAVKATVQR